MTHDDFKNKYKLCSKCINSQTNIKVFGSGNLNSEIAVVGECPGQEEITSLTPFVGPAGQLLNKILSSIDLKRDEIFFTNSVLCRTDNRNRTPTKTEYKNCRERLFEELSIIQPKVTLLVGGTALKSVIGDRCTMMESHGCWYTTLSKPCYFYYSLFHPAWILHSTTNKERQTKKKIMWTDIKKFRDEYKDIDSSFSFTNRSINEN